MSNLAAILKNLIATRELNRAEQLLHDCSWSDKAEAEVLLQANRLWRATGDRSKALEVSQGLTKRFPNRASFFLRLAYDSAVLGLMEPAVEALYRAISLDPSILSDPRHVEVVVAAMGVAKASEILKIDAHKASPGSDLASLAQKRFLFVSGVPRSGTSALGRLLQQHPQIAIYNELFSATRPYSPETFARSSVQKALRGRPLQRSFSETWERSKAAVYVGDKRPSFMNLAPKTFDEFEGKHLTVVHIVRRFEDVATSFDRRASDSGDLRWSPTMKSADAKIQTLVHTDFIRESISKYLRPEHKVFVVSYDQVFTDPTLVPLIFRHLALESDEVSQREIADSVRRSRNLAMRPKSELPESVRRSMKLEPDLVDELWREANAGGFIITERGVAGLHQP